MLNFSKKWVHILYGRPLPGLLEAAAGPELLVAAWIPPGGLKMAGRRLKLTLMVMMQKLSQIKVSDLPYQLASNRLIGVLRNALFWEISENQQQRTKDSSEIAIY